MFKQRVSLSVVMLSVLVTTSSAQTGHDLFSNAPQLGPGHLRLGVWNLRHLDVTGQAERELAGSTREEDFSILLATFAQAVRDLGLDLLAVVEHQPRAGESNRLLRVVALLNGHAAGPWRCDETRIDYDDPDDPYGNLQFAVLWNTDRGISIDAAKNRLLDDLRQPRDEQGTLLRRESRVPWLVPVRVAGGGAQPLEFDLLVVHLKSGGDHPQAAEVDSLVHFIRRHQTARHPRHLILCGDWNIRPDQDYQGRGRSRLEKLAVPQSGGSLMRILTVGDIAPSLEAWDQLELAVGRLNRFPPLIPLLPYSHLNLGDPGFDTLLDHIAISRSLDELFDHPVRARLATGEHDLLPGVRIVRPQVPEEHYLLFTDHLPVTMILRTDGPAAIPPPAPPIRIVAVKPNPLGDETADELVQLKNVSSTSMDLRGWQLRNSSGSAWTIGAEDNGDLPRGNLHRGHQASIRRQGRPMTLSNSGDTIALFDNQGNLVHVRTFGPARTGQVLRFE